MKLVQYTVAFLMGLSFVFGSHVEAKAKHASEQTRSRVMKEIEMHNAGFAQAKYRSIR